VVQCCRQVLVEAWLGLVDVARRVIGCRLTQDTRVQSAYVGVASTIRQAP
jgi:hypothetical protein